MSSKNVNVFAKLAVVAFVASGTDFYYSPIAKYYENHSQKSSHFCRDRFYRSHSIDR